MKLYDWDVVALEVMGGPVTAGDCVAEDHEDPGRLTLEEREEPLWCVRVCVGVRGCMCEGGHDVGTCKCA